MADHKLLRLSATLMFIIVVFLFVHVVRALNRLTSKGSSHPRRES